MQIKVQQTVNVCVCKAFEFFGKKTGFELNEMNDAIMRPSKA